jgi:hypothetical protein
MKGGSRNPTRSGPKPGPRPKAALSSVLSQPATQRLAPGASRTSTAGFKAGAMRGGPGKVA